MKLKYLVIASLFLCFAVLSFTTLTQEPVSSDLNQSSNSSLSSGVTPNTQNSNIAVHVLSQDASTNGQNKNVSDQIVANDFKDKSNADDKSASFHIADKSSSESDFAKKQNAPYRAIPHYCPAVSELVKLGLRWTAREERWKSFSPSFAEKIDHFIGAQWIGVNVGKIICLYVGEGAFDFPVALEPAKAIPVMEPKDIVTWTNNPNENDAKFKGRKFCNAKITTDCPFFLQNEKIELDVYEEIKYVHDRLKEGSINNDAQN